ITDSGKNFLYMHLFGGHTPYFGNQTIEISDRDHRFKENISVNMTFVFNMQYPGRIDIDRKREIMKKLDPAERSDIIRFLTNRYDERLYYYDSKLGNLFDYLKKQDLYKDSMIVVTADHGESFGSHGFYFTHANVYREVLHVPLIIKFPDNRFSGKKGKQLVRLLDIVPTIYDVLDVRNEETTGKSLIPTLEGENLNLTAYSNYRHEHSLIDDEYHYIFRNASWKIQFLEKNQELSDKEREDITDRTIKEELYNFKEDPEEKANIIKKETVIGDRLRGELMDILEDSSSEIHNKSMDENIKKRLEELGYLK
ncbi:MAG: sulfatase, partial [Candidatus Aenigmatarchaeota archaeon]